MLLRNDDGGGGGGGDDGDDDDGGGSDDDGDGVTVAGIYKNYTKGLMSDALCDEVDLSQFCQHVRLLDCFSTTMLSSKNVTLFVSFWFLQTLADFCNIWQTVYRVNLERTLPCASSTFQFGFYSFKRRDSRLKM